MIMDAETWVSARALLLLTAGTFLLLALLAALTHP